MICRLCLIDLYSEISVPLFNDFGNSDGPELVKIILKYLHIDITSADEISTAICHECSKHLKEFDEYCACVKKQQIMLSQTALLGEANAENIADATLSVEPMEVEVKCELGCLTMESQLKCEPEETVVTEQELISGLIRTSSSYSVSSSSSFLHEANTSGSAQIVNPQKIDDSSPSLDNHVHTLPDANTIRLFQPIQKIYKNYLMGISLKDKDRIQISKAVIDEYLKDAPEKLVHQEEFKKLAETIKEVFPSELVSMYYIPSIGHQQASGKLYNAYNNKINALKASRELNTRSKACVSTDVTPDTTLNEIVGLYKEQRNILDNQQDMLINQQVLLEKITDKIFFKHPQINIFPLKTVADLHQVDKEAEKINHHDLITYIKSILGTAKIHKSIGSLLSEEVLLASNWDGAKKLFKLNSLKVFNTYVFEAVRSETMGFVQYEEAIKKGIHLAKQRSYKKVFRNKN